MKPTGHIFMVLAGLALVAAIVYGLLASELAGAVMLGVFAVALLYIATVLTSAGQFDTAENDPDAEPEIGPEHAFPPSWWPVIMAVGACAAIIGLKFSVLVLGLGFAVFLVATIGWFLQAGRQHAEKAAHHSPQVARHGDGGH